MCGVIPPKATNTADTQDLDPWQETLPQEDAWLFLEVFCHEKRLRAEMGTIVLHCGGIRGLLSHFASAKWAEKRVDRVSAFSGLAWKMSYWSISSPFWRICSPRNWRFTRCWAGNLSAVVLNFSRQEYGSKWSSGEVMRQKNYCWLIHSSSICWRLYASEMVMLWYSWHFELLDFLDELLLSLQRLKQHKGMSIQKLE